jgi:hypothetical protein
LDLDELGRDEGNELSHKPGKGAVVHRCAAEADFDGLPGDESPPRQAVKPREPVKRKRKEVATAPPERYTD